MLASDFRKMAREKLSGKWGTAVKMVLAYMLTFFVIGLVQGLLPETGLLASIISVVDPIYLPPFALTNLRIVLTMGLFSYSALLFSSAIESASPTITHNGLLKRKT